MIHNITIFIDQDTVIEVRMDSTEYVGRRDIPHQCIINLQDGQYKWDKESRKCRKLG